MSTVLVRTNAGKAHDHAVSMGNAQPSKVAKIVLYDHDPILDPVNIKDITELPESDQAFVLEDFAQISVSSTATRFVQEINGQESFTGKAVATILENGIIQAYAPYLPERGGLKKDADFIWLVDVIIAEEDGQDVTVRYEPFDLREIREILLEQMKAELRTAFFCHGFKAPDIGEAVDCEQALDIEVAEQIDGIAAPEF